MNTSRCVAAAAGLILVVAGCTAPPPQAASTSWQFVAVDHQASTAEPPPPFAEAGPPPGVIREDWAVAIPADPRSSGVLGFHLAGGSLIAVTGWGVVGYHAGTGERLWHYREPGRKMFAATSGQTVVVATGTDYVFDFSGDGQGRLVGLDAGTGQVLWQVRNRWRVGLTVPRLSIADRVLPVLAVDPDHADPLHHRLVGLDVGTGQPAWERDLGRCGVPSLAPPYRSDGSLVLVGDFCRGQNRWRAYDPDTGWLVWTRALPRLVHAADVTVRDRAAVVIDDAGLLLVRPDGTTLTHEVGLFDADDPIGFFLPVRDGAVRNLVDVRTGATVSTGWPPLPPGGAAVDEAEALYTLDEQQGPVPGLVMGHPGDDVLRWAPMPGSETVDGPVIWAGTVGGRLLLARQSPEPPPRVRVFAYSSTVTDGPVAFGGVPQSYWPDPCDLLPVGDATGAAERFASAPMSLGTEQYPTRACRVFLTDPGHVGVDPVEVEVIWVAATTRQAERWLGGKPGPPGVDEVVDDGYSVLARIGRVIVELRGYPGADLQPLLEALADQLADY